MNRPLVVAVVLASAAGCMGNSKLDVGTDAEPIFDPPFIDLGAPIGPSGCLADDPGRVTLHRLNRAEYDNTARDLLGVSGSPAKDFPADDFGVGFDNIADVLTTAPLLVEKYDAAAEALAKQVLFREIGASQRTRFEAETATQTTGGADGSGFWNLFLPGEVRATVDFKASGQYRISLRAFQDKASTENAIARVKLDGRVLAELDVAAERAAPQVYEVTTTLVAGPHVVAVEFPNDFHLPQSTDPLNKDRNLWVDWVEAEWVGSARLSASPKVMRCDPLLDGGNRACARATLKGFGRDAWRRPLSEGEVDGLLGLYDVAVAEGLDFRGALAHALHAMLLSPHFLFRVELDAEPTSTTPHVLNDFELAARLSYFLWSSTPDAELAALADQGLLQRPDVRAQQVERMLASPKSQALTQNFVGSWWYLRGVAETRPDPLLFPGIGPELKASMRRESELLFEALLKEDRDFLELFDADFTFLDAPLAKHYGRRIDVPRGETGPWRVATEGTRRGLLGHAAVLSVTSPSDRTSPVKRGKWVMQQLMCREPPPPPPGVEGLKPDVNANQSLRQKMEQHREDPKCAGCHAMMDPIGFGLEGYDAVGRARTMDGQYPIDDTGTLPGGRDFAGPLSLAQRLKEDKSTAHCVTEQLFIYGLGRAHETSDDCALEVLTEQFKGSGHRLSALVQAFVASDSFTKRRGEP